MKLVYLSAAKPIAAFAFLTGVGAGAAVIGVIALDVIGHRWMREHNRKKNAYDQSLWRDV